MNATTSTLCSIVMACFVGASTALAAPEEGKNDTPKNTSQKAAAVQKPMAYRPPLRGAPPSRISGGTRGAAGTPTLEVLAPNHAGLTTQAQPSLYWYVADAGEARMEITLIDDRRDEPLLEIEVDPLTRAGVQGLSLAEHGIELEAGIEYRWFVALVADPEQRSNDVVASGTIQYVETSAELEARLANSKAQERPALYASEGIWYDAVTSLSDLISADPDNKALYARRASLLEQVGLSKVADFDKQVAGDV